MVLRFIELLSPEEVGFMKGNREQSVLHGAVNPGFASGIRHLLNTQLVKPNITGGSSCRTALHNAVSERKARHS